MATAILYQEHTRAVKFSPAGGETGHLMEVRAGVDSYTAVSVASCLEKSVQGVLDSAVQNEGIDGMTAYLLEFALDAAKALRTAAGQEA